MTRSADALAELEAAESEMGFAFNRLRKAIDNQHSKQQLTELAENCLTKQGEWVDRVRKAITAFAMEDTPP